MMASRSFSSQYPYAMNNVHHHMGHLDLLDGQRESGKSILYREDSMNKGTEMANSKSRRGQ